jgi:hypothetical protein
MDTGYGDDLVQELTLLAVIGLLVPLPLEGGVPVRRSHGPILSNGGASGKAGAVQTSPDAQGLPAERRLAGRIVASRSDADTL